MLVNVTIEVVLDEINKRNNKEIRKSLFYYIYPLNSTTDANKRYLWFFRVPSQRRVETT